MSCSWLSKLFGKCTKEKKQYKKLTNDERSNIVTDYMINKMTYKNIAGKYGCSTDTVSRIIRKARGIA